MFVFLVEKVYSELKLVIFALKWPEWKLTDDKKCNSFNRAPFFLCDMLKDSGIH